MVVFFEDNYDPGYISVDLIDHNIYTDSAETKFSVSSEGLASSPDPQIMKDYEGFVRIRTSGHQYFLSCYFSGDGLADYKLYSVKLVYTID